MDTLVFEKSSVIQSYCLRSIWKKKTFSHCSFSRDPIPSLSFTNILEISISPPFKIFLMSMHVNQLSLKVFEFSQDLFRTVMESVPELILGLIFWHIHTPFTLLYILLNDFYKFFHLVNQLRQKTWKFNYHK